MVAGLPDFSLPYGRNIIQMAIEYTNPLHSKAIQSLPKLGFLV
jgi:hypothetical protein